MADDTPKVDPSAPLPTHHQSQEEIVAWYAHLGMYVQEFESLVQSVRSACVEIATPGTWEKPRGIQINLMWIVFSYQTMTLPPLFGILSALIAELFKDKNINIEKEDKELILTILKDIDCEITTAAHTRNDILHASWMIGLPHHSLDKDTRIIMSKMKPSKDGLAFKQAVKKHDDFTTHINACRRLAAIISYILVCVKYPENRRARDIFKKDKKKWAVSLASS